MTNNLRELIGNEFELRDDSSILNAFRYVDKTPQHKFVSVLVPLSVGNPFLLVTARDSFDEKLCEAMFYFISGHAADLSIERNVTIIEGFEKHGYVFDSVLVLNGSYHKMYEHFSDELNRQTLAAFPIMRFEFTGNETSSEMDNIRHEGPCIVDWNREPTPFLTMKFRNYMTGARSNGNRLLYTKVAYAEFEILKLTDDQQSFVEMMNYLGYQARIVGTADRYVVDVDGIRTSVERHHITRWLHEFVTKPSRGNTKVLGAVSR